MGAIMWGTRGMHQQIGYMSVSRVHEFVKTFSKVHHNKKGWRALV